MLTIVLLTMAREKSLDLSSRRLFIRTMSLCIACLAMDILSVVAIVYATEGSFPVIPTMIICKLYLLLLIDQGYAAFLYVANEFFAEGTHRGLRRAYRWIFIIGSAAIAILPISYYCSGRIVYSYGPSTAATYTVAFILLVSTMIMAFASTDVISRRRQRCILIWQGCWMVAAALQFLMPELLVVGFAAAFGLVLVHAELENPHESVDRMTGQFTSNAMYVYMRERYREKQSFAVMYLYADYRAGDFDLELDKTAMLRIANFLDEDDRSYVFHQTENSYAVIYKNEGEMRYGYERAVSDIEAAVGMPIDFNYTLIPDSSVFQSVDEFQQFQHYNERNVSNGETIVIREDQANEMRDYLMIRDKVTWALNNNRVEVFYQPIYDLEKHRFTSAEALVRLRDDDEELVMPGSFIPIAEENGLIVPLGTEVFRQVSEFLSTGKPQRLGIEHMEVNLSMAQFDEDNPATFVEQIMSRYQVDPREINLEITETADSGRRQNVLKNMETLIDKGITFSLDDFGTGRSNLDYFVSMPVQLVKFDYKFTNWYFENEKARSIIKGTVDIIRNMGLPIVAEGVETEQQLYAMKALGVTYIQGFYFSRPLPAGEFLRFLSENQYSAPDFDA